MPLLSISLSHEQIEQLLNHQDIIIDVRVNDATPAECRKISFFQLFHEEIRRQERNGCLRTSETYRVAYRKFWIFCHCRDIYADSIDAEMMESYQGFLRSQNLSLNTISFYMRILRTVYKKAVEHGMTTDRQPFGRVYTGQAKTAKRAISIEELRRIHELEIEDRHARFARDLFIFSFMTRGMSFVDIAYLRPSDIRNGVLTYKRRKTGQLISMQWEQEMQDIVERYPLPRRRPYLLPIIRQQNGKERNQYRHIQSEVNRQLKTVAQMAGISQNLTMYCARHSWASIARQMQVPLEVISRGMGHTHERTTEIYLKSISSTAIDQANRQIMELLDIGK